MAKRFSIVIVCFIVAYSGLALRLYTIQIKNSDVYIQRVETSQNTDELLNPPRGVIFFTDKSGKKIPAAMDRELPAIVANPKEINAHGDVAEFAHILAPLVNMEPDKLEKMFSNKKNEHAILVQKASAAQMGALDEIRNNPNSAKWVYTKKTFTRFYPSASSSAHVIGFVGKTAEDDALSGRYGLESYYDNALNGVRGNLNGDRISAAKPGEDILTTIDVNIQKKSAEILDRLVHDYNAQAGTVIVENPKTGAILAMASTPTFDPNEYSKSPISSFLNPSVQAIYEPGSIFKVITMAAGIDSGKITPDTTYVDTGSATFNGKKIQNWDLKAHGKQTMTNVIEQSINTGAVFAERQTGHKTFLSYLQRFGLGGKTGIDMPGELVGDLANLTKGEIDIEYANAAFGQGIAVTPIELLRAISAIANKGVMMRPYINQNLGKKEEGRIISAETAKKVTQMMVSAVDKAKVAAVPNYSIAGKTGTAQAVDLKYGGYTKDVINTYVGFGPASDVQFIILIKLDKPAGAPLAGLTVVPSFQQLAEFVINYYNITPDRVIKSEVTTP